MTRKQPLRPLTLADVRLSKGDWQRPHVIAAPRWAYDYLNRPIPKLWKRVNAVLNRRIKNYEEQKGSAWAQYAKQHGFPIGHSGHGRHDRRITICRVCGATFYGLALAITCTPACEKKRRDETRTRSTKPRPKATHAEIQCPECGLSFQPKRSDAVYCSVRCRVKHHRNHLGS